MANIAADNKIYEKDIEKQKAWFRQQELSDRGYQWIIEYDEKPIGVTSITAIDREKGTCTRGSYIVKTPPRSFWVVMDIYASQHDFVFNELGLNKIVLQVFEKNENVIKLNKLLGFVQTNFFENHVCKYGDFYNVVELELTKEEWERKKEIWNYNQVEIIVNK